MSASNSWKGVKPPSFSDKNTNSTWTARNHVKYLKVNPLDGRPSHMSVHLRTSQYWLNPCTLTIHSRCDMGMSNPKSCQKSDVSQKRLKFDIAVWINHESCDEHLGLPTVRSTLLISQTLFPSNLRVEARVLDVKTHVVNEDWYEGRSPFFLFRPGSETLITAVKCRYECASY